MHHSRRILKSRPGRIVSLVVVVLVGFGLFRDWRLVSAVWSQNAAYLRKDDIGARDAAEEPSRYDGRNSAIGNGKLLRVPQLKVDSNRRCCDTLPNEA